MRETRFQFYINQLANDSKQFSELPSTLSNYFYRYIVCMAGIVYTLFPPIYGITLGNPLNAGCDFGI